MIHGSMKKRVGGGGGHQIWVGAIRFGLERSTTYTTGRHDVALGEPSHSGGGGGAERARSSP